MKTALLSLALLFAPAPPSDLVVELRTVDGELVCTVHTRGARPAEILAEIAHKSERTISGLDNAATTDPIQVWLDDRPLPSVVQTLAACAGLRAHVNISHIELESDLGPGDDAKAFEDQCFASYLRAIRAHPDHPLAAEGGMVLGDFHAKRGDLRRAESEYTAVAQRFEDSKEAPEALLDSGLINERLGNWVAAREQFSKLANLRQVHPYGARAHLEIARCMAENNDGREALHMLAALDAKFPSSLSNDRQARLYVRAQALLAARKAAEAAGNEGDAARYATDAAIALATADDLGRTQEWDSDLMELRAQVLAHFGRNAEAARAWLAMAENTQGAAQQRAWIQAAQQAYEADDALAVLAVQKLAKGTRAEGVIEALAEKARQDLGLASGVEHGLGGDPLSQARLLMVQERQDQALALLEPLYQRREERPLDLRLELVTLYARALAASKGVDAAVAVLRGNLEAFEEPAARKLLCTTAGELYEDADRFDDALRAYGGQL